MLSVVLAAGLMAGCGQARDARERMRALEPHLELRRPDGPGPFPAALLVPGCSGFRPKEGRAHHEAVAQRLQARGYVVARVDYLAARAMRSCQGASVGTSEIGQDVLAVAAHLRAAPDVRAVSIVAIGESLGGGGVLAALGGAETGKPALLDRVIVYYPVCVGVAPWRAPVPVLMLLGAQDGVTPPGTCKALVSHVTDPASVEIHVYPGAPHGFNHEERPVERLPDGRGIGYHEEAATQAWREVLRFLANPSA
jgi:dienelactone hydrolase